MAFGGVARMIARRGRDVTITRYAAATHDDSTGAVTKGAATTVTVRAVIRGAKQDAIDGVSILQTDKFALVAHSALAGFVPKKGDDVVDQSVKFKVERVRPHTYKDAAVAYNLQLRA